MLQLGSKIGRYQVEALLGEGDLADTYRVSAEGRPYALRVLTVRDQGFGERLRRASGAQAHLDHPNLLRVVDIVEAEGAPGVVTEFVEGIDLEAWIASGPHEPAEVLSIFEQMVSGVRAAHEAKLIHRNLKPSKILFGRVGSGPPTVRIADFLLGKVRDQKSGNAAVTQLGTTFGTPQYMSPEQFRGAATVDERADLFALGCILYEMATGQRAFDGDNLLEVYQQVSGCEYRPVEEARPGLPGWVSELVAGLLTPDPKDRIQSAEVLLERVQAISRAPRPAPPPPVASPTIAPVPTPPPLPRAQKAPPGPAATPAGATPAGATPAGATPPGASGSKPVRKSPPTIDPYGMPQGARSPPPPPPKPPTLPPPTPGAFLEAGGPVSSDDDSLIGEEYLRPRRPTVLLVTAALLVGLTIGLGFVVGIALLVAWLMGAL